MTTTLELEQKDLRILVQSLENCLKTCEAKRNAPDAPCEDCDAARDLQQRLRSHLRS